MPEVREAIRTVEDDRWVFQRMKGDPRIYQVTGCGMGERGGKDD